MLTVRLTQAEHICSGTLRGEDVLVRGMVLDSRKVRPGSLFLALPGARTDGHDFLPQAREAGAAAALVTRWVDDPLPQLRVADVALAAADLARWQHRRLKLRTVAITGSNGKTTVKNLCRGILEELGVTLATRGNYNNELGLPLTLAELGEEHAFAVLEMGAGKPGDIEQLCRIATPDVALITNVTDAHLAQFDTREQIARTKGAIYAALGPKGTAIIPADDDFADSFRQLAEGRPRLSFGHAPADVSAAAIRSGSPQHFTLCTPVGQIEVELPLLGAHNIANALAAASVGLALGASLEQIARGLSRAQPEPRRLQLKHKGDLLIVDDSYNANPASLQAALEAVTALAGERWLALGDMLELGVDAAELHAQAGRQARQAGFCRLFAVGPLAASAAAAFGVGGSSHANQAELFDALCAKLRLPVTGTGGARLLLVKGSRSSAMDRVVDALMGAEEGACCCG
jgi:UDP-N-acetylmuramoyl-tripeptide--D-alanyl-D-alanine ligase